jgi:osmotically-inducible protein OsmY
LRFDREIPVRQINNKQRRLTRSFRAFTGSFFTTTKESIMKLTRRLATMLFAASLVATLAGCASTATKEGTGEFIDDSVITAKVKASIFNEPTLKSTEINVETFKGDVQLSGFVAQPQDAQKAVEIARGVKGVVSVKNDVRVK